MTDAVRNIAPRDGCARCGGPLVQALEDGRLRATAICARIRCRVCGVSEISVCGPCMLAATGDDGRASLEFDAACPHRVLP